MSDVVIIEKHLNENDRLCLHYSEAVNEVTVKIFRKSNPNIRFSFTATYKAKITYRLLKEITNKFVFEKEPDVEKLIAFVETNLRKLNNGNCV